MRIRPKVGHFISLPEITKLLDISFNLDIFNLLVEKHGIIEGEEEIEKLKNKKSLEVSLINNQTLKVSSGQIIGAIYDYILIDEQIVPIKRWKLLDIKEGILELNNLFYGYGAIPISADYYLTIMVYEKEAYTAYPIGIGLEEEEKLFAGEGQLTIIPYLYKINILDGKTNIQTKDLLTKQLEIQDFVKFGNNYYPISTFFNQYFLFSSPIVATQQFICVKKIRRRLMYIPDYKFILIPKSLFSILAPIRETFTIIAELTITDGLITRLDTTIRDNFSLKQIISIKDIISLIFATKEVTPVDPKIAYLKTVIHSVDFTLQEEAREAE